MNINFSSALNSIPYMSVIRERHFPAMVSLMKKIPFPSIGKSLSDRATLNIAGVLSLGLIAFIVRIFWNSIHKKPEQSSDQGPPASSDKGAQTQPRSRAYKNMASPRPAGSPFRVNFHTPAKSVAMEPIPIHPETPQGPVHNPITDFKTPHTIRKQREVEEATASAPVIDGPIEVLNKSYCPSGKSMISIPKIRLKVSPTDFYGLELNTIFTAQSCLYVNDTQPSLGELKKEVGKVFSPTSQAEIMNLLSILKDVGNKCIEDFSMFQLPLLTHGPVHCSISRDADRAALIVVNNLFYSDDEKDYQLWLIIQKDPASQEKSIVWEVSCYCTIWMQNPQHPLTFDPSLTEGLPTPLKNKYKEWPLWKNYVCIDSDQLVVTSDKIEYLEKTSKKNPKTLFFNDFEFKQACGNSPIWGQLFNNQDSLLELIANALPSDMGTPQLLTEHDEPLIVKTDEKDTVFALFSVLTKNKKFCEVGIYLNLTIEKIFFGRDKYFWKFKGGFYREMIRTEENKHALLTLFPNNKEDQIDSDTSTTESEYDESGDEEGVPDSAHAFGRTPPDGTDTRT